MGKPDYSVTSAVYSWEENRQAEALMIQCSAFDYRSYHARFVEEHLGLTDYDLLALPGGSQVLNLVVLPKIRTFFYKMVWFLGKKHHPKKIVLLGHEDCSWYKDYRFGPVHVDLKERQLTDLKTVAKSLHQLLGVPVEIYFASLDDGQVYYTKIDF